MNIVVLTAALSSRTPGTVREEFYVQCRWGFRAEIHGEMSRQHVPYAGILATLVVLRGRRVHNYLVPLMRVLSRFNFASLGIIFVSEHHGVPDAFTPELIKKAKPADVGLNCPAPLPLANAAVLLSVCWYSWRLTARMELTLSPRCR